MPQKLVLSSFYKFIMLHDINLSYFLMENHFGGFFLSLINARLSEKKFLRFIRSFKPDAAFLLWIPKHAVSFTAAGKHMKSKRKDF